MPSCAAGPLKAADWPSTRVLAWAQVGKAMAALAAATRLRASRRFIGISTDGRASAQCAARRGGHDKARLSGSPRNFATQSGVIRVTVQGGRAVKVQGDPDHPPTHGALGTKVSRYPERTYHAGRVLHPLRRDGPKGSGRFVRVGWDEALADIAQRLAAIAARDPQALVPYSYAGTMGLLQGESMDRRF